MWSVALKNTLHTHVHARNCRHNNTFYIHVTVHHNNFLFNKTNQMHEFPKILFCHKNSTCLGHFLCPLSGVIYCTLGSGIFLAGMMTASQLGLDVAS